jgi:hypothetical protein
MKYEGCFRDDFNQTCYENSSKLNEKTDSITISAGVNDTFTI